MVVVNVYHAIHVNIFCYFREKYEALAERESRKTQLNSIGHNHSRDSAIDADLQEWETETLDVELVSHCHLQQLE